MKTNGILQIPARQVIEALAVSNPTRPRDFHLCTPIQKWRREVMGRWWIHTPNRERLVLPEHPTERSAVIDHLGRAIFTDGVNHTLDGLPVYSVRRWMELQSRKIADQGCQLWTYRIKPGRPWSDIKHLPNHNHIENRATFLCTIPPVHGVLPDDWEDQGGMLTTYTVLEYLGIPIEII